MFFLLNFNRTQVTSSAGMNISESAGVNHSSFAGATMVQNAVADYSLMAANITQYAKEDFVKEASNITKSASDGIFMISESGSIVRDAEKEIRHNSGENSFFCLIVMIFRNIIFSLLFLTLLFSLLSCKRDKYEWSPDITAPAHYPAGGAMVQFFYKGSPLGGASSNTAISGGWGKGGGSFTSGEEKKPVPDSVSVSWDCAAEEIIYEGGAKLPRERMLELFRRGYMSSTRNRYKPRKETFAYITAGMAPGGNVTVWLNTDDPDRSMDVEIMRFKADKIGVSDTSQSITLHTSTGEEAKTILKYISVHGIPKKVWEKPEGLYAYNLGYSHEENDMEIKLVNLYSKAGTGYQDITNFWDINTEVPWLKPNVPTTVLHRHLPVHIIALWGNFKKQLFYMTDIVLLGDFEARFSAGYTNASTGKKEAYTELVIGVEKGSEYGRIWLSGKNKIL